MSRGTRAQLLNLAIEQEVKKAVEDAFQVSGIVTRSDVDDLLVALEKRIKDSFAAELETMTKSFLNRIEALEAKVAMCGAHFEGVGLGLGKSEKGSQHSSLRLYNSLLPKDAQPVDMKFTSSRSRVQVHRARKNCRM